MKKRLAICTPTRDGLVDINYTASMVGSIKQIEDWDIEPSMISGASDIVGARNAMFNAWYYKTDVEAMMFVDSDISWHPNDLERMLSYDCGVIAANYPKKSFKPMAFLQSATLFQTAENCVDPLQALRASYDYVSTGRHDLIIDGEFEGLMTVGGVGMGFFLIHREAAKILLDYAEETMHKVNFSSLDEKNPVEGYPVFNPLVTEDNFQFSEDFAFCRRLRDAGITIFLDPRVPLRHSGYANFDGCFQEQMLMVELAKKHPEVPLPEGNLSIKEKNNEQNNL
jgi:hypothetical protein